MKKSLFLSILLGSCLLPGHAENRDSISLDGEYILIEEKDSDLSGEQTYFEHKIETIDSGTTGGTLHYIYDGLNPAACSITEIRHLSGSGDVALLGTSNNTLKLFRLAENATQNFTGNLTLSNYSASWDSQKLHDNAAILQLGNTSMSGSIMLDAAGYCTEDSYYIAALGLDGDTSIGGLDAPWFIKPAAYLYSGSLKPGTTSLEHAKGLAAYITPAEHTLTINTDGSHHFHGRILTPLTIIKKGSGTQSFTGEIASGSSFEVQSGTLNLDTETTSAARIQLNAGTLNQSGDLNTNQLNMHNGQLSVSGKLHTGHAGFSGRNTLEASEITAGEWTFSPDSAGDTVLILSEGTRVQLQTLQISYDKAETMRGWYKLVENTANLHIDRIQGQAEFRENSLFIYVADGERTLPRNEAADLTWQAASGTWQTGAGHADMSWKGPDSNSNFHTGDSVHITQAAEITLFGELRPGQVKVNHDSGTVSLRGDGSLCGNTGLCKDGNGVLEISTANSYTGETILTSGDIITRNSAALGSSRIILRGGTLNLAEQALANGICIVSDAEITGGGNYTGQLELCAGTLQGDTIQLIHPALLKGGNTAASFTGCGGVRIQGQVNMSAASTYTGETIISAGVLTTEHAQALGSSQVCIQSGTWDMNHTAAANELSIDGTATLLHADNFQGSIHLKSGELFTESTGAGRITCSGTATLHAGKPLLITSSIHNTGLLKLEGVFYLDALARSTNATMVDAFGNMGGTSGFQQDSGTTIELTTGNGSICGGATFLFQGAEISLDTHGRCQLGAETHFSQYHIASGHRVAVSDIRAVAGNALQRITMNGGQLTADASATISASEGDIHLTSGTLSGSCTDSNINATGGVLNLEFSGHNQISGSGQVQLAGTITNSGELTLLGEFHAEALELQETTATRTEGSSPASGFARQAHYQVRVVNGGSVNAGASIIHGSHRLILEADGTATAGGAVDYSEYLLTGNDTARTSRIQRAELQCIRMTGGTLTIDTESAPVNATAGTVIIETGSLNGGINGSTQVLINGTARLTGNNMHTGGTILQNGELTITTPQALGIGPLTITGHSSLCTEGCTLVLNSPIDNSGHLQLDGRFEASALAAPIAATLIDARGNEGGDSGFIRDAGSEVRLITGGSVDTTRADIMVHGQKITPDSTGYASLPGQLHTDTYYISGTHSTSTAEIQKAAGGLIPGIQMESGTLLVNSSTERLQASGGIVQVENAHLGGSISGNTRLEILGNAVLTSANSYTGGTTIATGTLRAAHEQALGTGAVHLGSNNRSAAPMLDLGNFSTSNHIILSGSSVLRGLENFNGSITMQPGAETSVSAGEVLNLHTGQTLTLAAGGNTIHGCVNLDGGTITLTGGPLKLNGVVYFSKPTTIDLSQYNQVNNAVILTLDFPSVFDEDMLKIILPEHLQDDDISFDPQTGTLHVAPESATTPDHTHSPGPDADQSPTLALALNRNQRGVYEILRSIDPAATTGELAALAESAAQSTDTAAIRQLMNRVNGAGYTALVNSIADTALSHLRQLRQTAGSGHRLSPAQHTAVGIHAFNHYGRTEGSPGYKLCSQGGRLMVEQQIDDRLQLGLSLSHGCASITPDTDDSHTDTQTHADIYALFAASDWHIMCSAGFGLHEFTLSRQTAGNSSAETPCIGGNSANFSLEAARSFTLDAKHILQPYLALQTTTATVDAFHESGSTAALHADKQQISLTELTLGLRYQTTIDSFHLGVHTALSSTMGDTESEMNLHFADAPDKRFRVYGARRSYLGYTLGMTAALPLSQSCSLHASTAVQLRKHTQNIDSQFGIFLHF